MSLFGDCAVKRAKYKPTTSALREYGICGFRAPDEDRDATPSSELRESAPLLGGDALPCCDGDGRRRRACSCAGLPCAVWWLCVLPLSAVATFAAATVLFLAVSSAAPPALPPRRGPTMTTQLVARLHAARDAARLEAALNADGSKLRTSLLARINKEWLGCAAESAEEMGGACPARATGAEGAPRPRRRLGRRAVGRGVGGGDVGHRRRLGRRRRSARGVSTERRRERRRERRERRERRAERRRAERERDRGGAAQRERREAAARRH